MSEYRTQKKEKPSIYDLTDKYLTGKAREDLLDFIAFLKENKMTPQWGSTNTYTVSSKNRRVCIIKISENVYWIWCNTQYDEAFNACFEDEGEAARRYLRSTVVHCWGCGSCKPGISRDILGETVTGACLNPVIRMKNPDDMQLALAKKLVLLRRKALRDGTAPKLTYIAMKKR